MPWIVVYKHGPNGEAIEGSKSNLCSAIRDGSPIRFSFCREWPDGRRDLEVFDAAQIKIADLENGSYEVYAQSLLGGGVQVLRDGSYVLSADIITHAVSTLGHLQYLSVYRPVEGDDRVAIAWLAQSDL